MVLIDASFNHNRKVETMKTLNYKTPAMHCNHCVMHIKNALQALDGVEAVEADLNNKEVEVEFNAPATDELIREKLAEIGYPAELED
jgi:copper chaperone